MLQASFLPSTGSFTAQFLANETLPENLGFYYLSALVEAPFEQL